MFQLTARTLAGLAAAVTVAGLAAGTAIAQDQGAQVFNFGGCMSSGQPDGFPSRPRGSDRSPSSSAPTG